MTEQGYQTIRIENEDGIAWLIMNRPEKRNAMNPLMHYEMDRALPELEGRSGCSSGHPDRGGGRLLRGPGPEGVFSRPRRRPGRTAPRRRGERTLAQPALGGLQQADHRHGQRLLHRRRLHADAELRLCARRRGCDVLPQRGQLAWPFRVSSMRNSFMLSVLSSTMRIVAMASPG